MSMQRSSRARSRSSFSAIAGAHAAGRIASRSLSSMASSFRSQSKRRRSESRATNSKDDKSPLYGTTFTSKIAYKSKRTPTKRVKFGKKKAQKWLYQASKMQNSQNTVTNNTFTLSNLSSQQAWWSLDLCNAGEIFNLIATQLPLVSTVQAYRDYNLWLKDFNLKYYLTNTGTANVELEIYHIVPRRDVNYADLTSATPMTSNGNILANYFNNRYPLDTLPDAQGDVVPTTFSLGITPFQYRNFCRLFKIVKIRVLKMGVGETFVERDKTGSFNLNLARLGIMPPQNNATTPAIGSLTKWYLKGISRMILFKIRGFPTAASSSPAGQISLAWEVTTNSKVIQTKPGTDAFTGQA